MSLDALLVFCIKQHWPWHKVTTVGFYQLASVSLHCSSDFNPLTYNEVYCDMIALQYIEENCMNAVHSGHTQTLMLAIPPHEDTHTHVHTQYSDVVSNSEDVCDEWRRQSQRFIYDWHEWVIVSHWLTLTHWFISAEERGQVEISFHWHQIHIMWACLENTVFSSEILQLEVSDTHDCPASCFCHRGFLTAPEYNNQSFSVE